MRLGDFLLGKPIRSDADISYWQTIGAYRDGGGAYTVSRQNLGTLPGLLAAAALLLDYLLNVAVAISAGVGALVSAVPALFPHTLALCLVILSGLTWINLRGVRSTGAAVLVPTYLFVACTFSMLATGWFGSAGAAPAPAAAAAGAQPSGLALAWLLVRAFSNGCTAMTGVEAVSNGVPLFATPSERGGRRTLLGIVGILIVLLVGEAGLCRRYGIVATAPGQPGYESILSQLTATVFGRGALYYLTIGSVIVVLALSANTSFADFPRVCGVLARDGFLPEPLAHRGRRLTFSHGILLLSGAAALLLIAFGGITDHLIPLFALGALGAFTMSQLGMVQHWRRQGGSRARWALTCNLLGAIATGLTWCCVLLAKLTEGAWITLLVISGLLVTLLAVRRHYDFISHATHTDPTLELAPLPPPLAVVPVRRWNGVSLKALRMALSLCPEVIVVQVLTSDRQLDDLRPRWRELVLEPAERLGFPPPRLMVVESQYRRVIRRLLGVVSDIAREYPERPVAVLLPELIEPRWYHALLHGRTARRLAHSLRTHGPRQVLIVSTPWYLGAWQPERRWLQLRPRTAAAGTQAPG